MAEYTDIPSIAVIYEGTVESFNDLADKSKYYDRVVFITGSTATNALAVDKQQAIWVSAAEGKNAHFLNMSDVSTLAAQLSYIDGLAIESTDGLNTVRTPYEITGGKGFLFAGDNGITISIDPNSAVDINNKLYWRIKVDASAIKTTAESAHNIATSARDVANSASATIIQLYGGSLPLGDDPKSVADIAKATLVGETNADSNDDTINGAKNYAKKIVDDLSTNKTFVKPSDIIDDDTDKIKASLLPDVILGQLMYGGIIGDKANNIDGTPANITINPSELFESTFGKNVDKENLTPTTFLAENYRNVYFIVGNPNPSNAVSRCYFTWDGVDYQVGDWLLSDGEKWTKIDNTDAVSSVAEMTGVISTSQLATKLATASGSYTDPLAKKSDIKIDSISAKASVDGAEKTYFSTTGPDTTNKNVSFSAEVKTMGAIEDDNSANGFADARDVYNFLKARLSIKVISNS